MFANSDEHFIREYRIKKKLDEYDGGKAKLCDLLLRHKNLREKFQRKIFTMRPRFRKHIKIEGPKYIDSRTHIFEERNFYRSTSLTKIKIPLSEKN
jgi:hypothetical protein